MTGLRIQDFLMSREQGPTELREYGLKKELNERKSKSRIIKRAIYCKHRNNFRIMKSLKNALYVLSFSRMKGFLVFSILIVGAVCLCGS